MRRFLMSLLVLVFVAGLVVFGAVGWWLHEPLTLKPQPGSQVLDLEIEPGTPAQRVAGVVAASGVDVQPVLLYAWFRLSGQARQIKAGSYEITPGTTPRRLLSMLVRGEESLKSVTLVEGWNFRQVRAALQKAEALKPDTQGLGAEAIMAQLGKPGVHPEGRFFPDTYTYAKGSSDLAVLKRAARAMDKRLEAAWALRSADTPLKTPDEALILASIVEKETGKPLDRPEIGGVFSNRLRIGMMLQTDPTVIYGMGEQFDGNLRKRDLQADTPYNTYTRTGLPPTPIAMPGKAALLAAVQPAQTKALYFVARGDGTSHFSSSLDEHNRAVNKFQRNQ
ncbi:MAG: endolytic transglycosylase MltG [Polaromonas sp.]|nr:endolytic transglycosylase MltG [Polaromonas sp.]MDP2448690.1 endolytic transglycosylase MltG [Polaromonas sp.]MDP3246519.1 endolytic transglycosylase MltG [Polaromonas sp.]MDP3755526.1 endolytic transglycosylase MltG [Polaromonas sp.]